MSKHFAFFSRGKSPGGVEKLICDVADGLLQRGHRITVFSEVDQTIYPFEIASGIQYEKVQISNYKTLGESIKKVKPDVIYVARSSDYDHVCFITALAFFDLGIPLISSEHTPPAISKVMFGSRSRREIVFSAADGIHLLSEDFSNSFPQYLQDRIYSIPNMVKLDVCDAPDVEKENIIVSVGRLSFEKGHSSLISAFKRISDIYPHWRLVICGEGNRRGEIQTLIKYYNLQDQVFLRGHVKNIEKELSKASFFVLPSLWEGFGIAAAESILCGTPVVAFSSCEGVKQVVKNGETGILVDGDLCPHELSKVMSRLIEDRVELGRLQENCLQEESPFSKEKIIPMWEKMLLDISLKKGNTRLQNIMKKKSEYRETYNLLYPIKAGSIDPTFQGPKSKVEIDYEKLKRLKSRKNQVKKGLLYPFTGRI